MNPKSITITRPDGTHTEYNRNFMAVVVDKNGLITTAANASTTDIIIGTAWLNAKTALRLLKERRSGFGRMLLLSRYLRHWIHTFFVCYKEASTKEAQHE